MKYEKFKLELCAEYCLPDGTTDCLVLHPEAHVDSVKYLHDVEEDQTYLKIFWRIYGVKPDGTSEYLADGNNEQDMKAKFDFLQGLIEIKEMYVSDVNTRIEILQAESQLRADGSIKIPNRDEYNSQIAHWQTTKYLIEEKLK